MKLSIQFLTATLLSPLIFPMCSFASPQETPSRIHYLNNNKQQSNFSNLQQNFSAQNSNDANYVYLFNTTIRSSMAETVYVMAHNKNTHKWDYLGYQLSAWDPSTFSKFTIFGIFINEDIAIDRRVYDEVYVNGYAGTWPSEHMTIDASTKQSIKTKAWWDGWHLKIDLEQFDKADWG